jgi:Domain of unknown function (DUF4190)/Domain of unknown function (DUF1707)
VRDPAANGEDPPTVTNGPVPYGPPSYGPPSYGPPSYGPGPYGRPPYPAQAPGVAHPGMLAAAVDRERTLDVLKAAYGEGRLTKDEFETRSGRVMAARRYADLTAIIADLPAGPLSAPMPYHAPGYYPIVPAMPTNGLAIGSLVCGILEFFTLGLASIPAVILGHMAREQIRRTGERGDGMAITGLVLGYFAIAGWVLVLLILALHR